jgi:hypothetical protein
MAESPTLIANQALGLCGAGPVLSFEDPSEDARRAELYYPGALEELLASAPWPFATRWSPILAQRLPDPTRPDDVPRYPLPADLLHLWAVSVASGWGWYREGDDIVTMGPEPRVRYTRRETDTTRFPPYFTTALMYELASRLAPSIVSSDTLVTRLVQQARAAAQTARSMSGIQHVTNATFTSPELIAVRVWRDD